MPKTETLGLCLDVRWTCRCFGVDAQRDVSQRYVAVTATYP